MAGNEWQPQDVGLQQILQLLKESQSHDNNIQRSVQQVYNFLHYSVPVLKSH